MTYALYVSSFAIALVCVYLVRSLEVAFKTGLRQVPGPWIARFSGVHRLSLVLNGKAPEKYRRVHDEYGSIVRVGPNHVSVSDPLAIPVIYGVGSRFVKTPFYSVMSPAYEGTTMHTLFSACDPEYHKALKRPVGPLFSMANMRKYEPYADECTAIFIRRMREMEGQSVDLSTWLQWYAFDVVACITFQRRFGFMEEARDINQMIETLNGGFQYIKVVGQFPGLHQYLLGSDIFTGTLKKIFPDMPDPVRTLMQITEDEVVRYDTEGKQQAGRTDFLAQLREMQVEGGQVTHRDMMNHLCSNLLAGSDTTAISLCACFYYLIKNPRAYQRLVAEIDAADNRGQLSEYVTYEQCLELSYLQAVIKEALRMHPGVGFPLEREVPPEGATVCDVALPAGTIVSMSANVVQMDQEVFGKDAEQFRPERWIDASPEQLKLMDRSFLAFGHGTRTCIGKNISILEMGKFIPQILRHFELEWASPEPEWKTATAWFWKQSGVIVEFRSRIRR